jgi:sugar phosphate isomerase/epimerase
MKRRTFLKQSTALAAGTALGVTAWAQPNRSIGLQLYTLRDVIFRDPKGVLKQVADMGYQHLETFGYRDGKLFGMTNADFVAYVRSLGMKITSGHYGIDQVRGNWEKAVSDAKEAGQDYLVVPWLPEAERTADGYKRVCADLNKGGEVCKKYGMRMGYHNHAFEFDAIGAETAYDLMLRELDNGVVTMEMDIYWVVKAGRQPLDYFEKHPGRFELWHVKDMDKTDPAKNADVGTGAIDFKPLFASAAQSGLKHFYVEQETYPVNSVTSTANSLQNLKKML